MLSKIIIILSLIALSGCASRQVIVDVPKPVIDSSLLDKCDNFILFDESKEASFNDAIDLLVINSKIYQLCSLKNDAKIKTIESLIK